MIPSETTPSSKSAQGPKKGYKNRRRFSRELALQGIYQWRLAGGSARDIGAQLQEVGIFSKADGNYFSDLLHGVLKHIVTLEEQVQTCLDRQLAELSPVECSILLLSTYELIHHPEIPCRAVINEAIELAKSYGGTDGHKYVNGVLDKLGGQLRAAELEHQYSPKNKRD